MGKRADRKLPKTEVTASEELVIGLKLAKAGYYGGDPERVINARVDHVLAAIQYESFLDEYEGAYLELNK